MIIKNSLFERNLKNKRLINPCKLVFNLIIIIGLIGLNYSCKKNNRSLFNPSLVSHLPELEMSGGDPYIRALMLTISSSESNHNNSYYLLYGGSHVHNLKQHPDRCIPINIGPNRGKCSTAAGRYQFLTSTWQEKARKYHPNPQKSHRQSIYSFEPKYQDIVVYRWLNDKQQWNVDLLTLLKEDRVEEVLRKLSNVWTSLGGGIEDNSITPYLPSIYRYFLDKELNKENVDQNSL